MQEAMAEFPLVELARNNRPLLLYIPLRSKSVGFLDITLLVRLCAIRALLAAAAFKLD